MAKNTTGGEAGASEAAATAGPLAAALSVRPGEIETVKRIFVAAFVLGAALVCFYSGGNAIFLTRYEIGILPWVYIVNAVLVIAVGLLYSLVAQRVSATVALNGSTTASAVSVFLLWLWAMVSNSDIVAFAMAAWYRLLFIFALLTLWEVASGVFDIRQSKRLFPAVGLGIMLAFIIGGVLTPLLTGLIGATNLVLLSAIFFAIYTVVYARLIRVEDVVAENEDTPPAGPRDILNDPYARLLAGMRSITILLIFVGEFVFYEQAASTFESEDSLAGFLGLFIATSTLVMVIFTAVASARYIAHAGMRIGLMTMPIVIGSMAVVTGLWGVLVGVNTGFFVLVVLCMLLNIVVANAIEPAVGAVMYQPLPADQRMSVRLAVDGWLGSFALLLAGLLLLGFEVVGFESVVPFVWLLVVVGLVGVAMAARLHVGYAGALRVATTRAFGGATSLADLAAAADTTLLQGSPGAGLAPALLGGIDADGVLISSMLEHPDPAIAQLALESIEGRGHVAGVAALVDPIGVAAQRADLSESAVASALQSMTTIDPHRAAAIADGIDPRPGLVVAVLGARLSRDMAQSNDRAALDCLLDSDNSADRTQAAHILGATSKSNPTAQTPVVAELLAGLLDDDDSVVVHAALAALDGRVSSELAPRVLALGEALPARRSALKALRSSPNALATIDREFDGLPLDYRSDLAEHVYPGHTRRPTDIHRFVEPGQPSEIRHAGFMAIRRSRIVAPATVGRMIRDDLELAMHLVAAYRDVSAEFPELGHALAAEFALARATIYAALAIDYPTDRITDIEALVRRGLEDERANAVEALDVLLATELRRRVVPVIEPITIADAVEQVPGLSAPLDVEFWLPQFVDDNRLTDWTRRTAKFYVIATHPQDETEDEVAMTTSPSTADTSDVSMAATIGRIGALREVDIFSTLPYPLLADLAQLVQERSVDAGEVIIKEGAVDHGLYALTAGQVTVSGTDVQLEAGTVFGELAVLSPAPRSATVTAVSACTIMRVERESLLALADRRPEVMVEIASVLASRLRGTASSQ